MNTIIEARKIRQELQLGEFWPKVETRVNSWKNLRLARRLKNREASIWAKGYESEIQDRLGWLVLPEIMLERAAGLISFAEEAASEGLTRIALLGMGGSSLAAETFNAVFGNKPGHPSLSFLDSTHPAAVLAFEKDLDPDRTLFLVASKSGTTLETLSFFRYFWDKIRRATKTPGRHFAAITDSGTPLEELGREKNFRRIFIVPPDVGGRYSALTEFGLVPAALIGMDIRRFLEGARMAAEHDVFGVPEDRSSSLLLGAALGEIAPVKDKLTILASPTLQSFPNWLEQLIAESTGKDGKGIVPIIHEPLMPTGFYARDRIFADIALEGDDRSPRQTLIDALEAAGHPVFRIRLQESLDLGQEIFRWEIATASAAAVLDLHPFNQPDVDLSKKLALKAMENAAAEPGQLDDTGQKVSADNPGDLRAALGRWFSLSRPGDYFGIQAYLAPSLETFQAIDGIRLALLKRSGLATTFGYGPRFLHSTGQLHKGGPDKGLFLQIIDKPGVDRIIPQAGFSFGELIRAQAAGDLSALRRRGRRVLQIDLGEEVGAGLARILEALET